MLTSGSASVAFFEEADMNKIGFSGTLDPITNGHMWVIGEARAMARQVVVFLSENTLKKPQFSAEERKRIIELSTCERGWDNVQVQIVRGSYTAHAAKKAGCDYLIRGIRNTADFDYENLIQQTNVDVLHGAKSIFVMPPRDLGSVSSSFVRALQGPVGWHWIVRQFVPTPAYDAWVLQWLQQEWQQLWPGEGGVDGALVARRDACFVQLTGSAHYGGSRRYYHNLDHLVHGLSELRVWASYQNVDNDRVLQLKKAFWFHDAVYGSPKGAASDEEHSAQFWLQAQLETDPAVAQAVADLIRATDHFQESHIVHPLKEVMLGADLAILGQDDVVYDGYAQQIRAEYAHVEDAQFASHRVKALLHLCQRAGQQQLFADPWFNGQYNAAALANMQREIARLAL
jgi:pantetheine-phosphate adenylyltransferase